jgi:hypothetical protein
MADPGTTVEFSQTHDADRDQHRLELRLPASAPDPLVSVVVVEFDGDLDVDAAPLQQPSGRISLPAYLAQQHKTSASSALGLSHSKVIQGWTDPTDWLSWQFKVSEPGEFAVKVIVSSPWHGHASPAGHVVSASVGDQRVVGSLAGGEPVDSPRAQYFPESVTCIGKITIDGTGTFELSLKAEALDPNTGEGLTVSAVELAPIASA